MKITVLIALGPNSVEVPCRLFSSMADGMAFMTSRFGTPQKWDRENKKYIDDPGSRKWHIMDEDDERIGALFTHYYSGCGGVGAFTLSEVETDSVFVGWDLD